MAIAADADLIDAVHTTTDQRDSVTPCGDQFR